MGSASQDLRDFLSEYESRYGDDVLTIDQRVSPDQEITAMVWELAATGRRPLLRFTDVDGVSYDLVTNMFASRQRVERMIGAEPGRLHDRYQELTANLLPLAEHANGPVLDHLVTGDDVDLRKLPLITHFATDLGPYITSGIVCAEDPVTGVGNLSYHRAVIVSPTTLATSLHSRGDLWRMLHAARQRGEPLKVAMIIGGHPLFMLAASARAPANIDERQIAAALFGAPLEVIRTPNHGLAVPATSEVVLEGKIDPEEHADEGPFGEFSGYSSDRSTHNVIKVDAVMTRRSPIWVDVVGGNSDEHLNLARVPREAEMIDKLKQRFPSVTRVHYPNSGTHFHCYVAVAQQRAGEARQVLVALLGWDPYLKTVVAVDDDIDLSDDASVLWAIAVHVQPAADVFVIDGLPGSALDPSSSPTGRASRLAIDATRPEGFDAVRIAVDERAVKRARQLLSAVESA